MNSDKACIICEGACCNAIVLDLDRVLSPDALKWARHHGEITAHGVRLEVKCLKKKDGRCSIYSNRPNVCKTFPVGNPMCLDSIARYCPEKLSTIKSILGIK